MSSANVCEVAVFAKAALAGEAKTRLIPELGAVRAAGLHLALVRQALETALGADVGRVQLWYTQQGAALNDLAAKLGVQTREQCAGDLGARMSHCFDRLLAHASGVILVGSDCPSRSRQDFREASAQLRSGCDAVLGPTEDGGYHLIALRHVQAALFAGIDWSTPLVMQQTRERMRALRLRWHELPMRWDIDRPEDLARLRADPQFAELTSSYT
jgi:uncharacterized protein